MAIVRALEAVKDRTREVIVHTDSSYAIGVLSKGWKAKANAELIANTRVLVGMFTRLTFQWVKGHAGIPENERCDELARTAVKAGAVAAPAS
jgi:ribonuclease HI